MKKNKSAKRLSLFLLLFVAVCSAASGQTLRNLFVKNKNQSTPAGGVRVYTFRTKAQAEQAMEYANYGNSKRIEQLRGFIAQGVTDDVEGVCTLLMTGDGYVLLDPVNLNMNTEIASTKATNANGDVVCVIGRANNIKEEMQAELREIQVVSKIRSKEGQAMVTPKSCGGELLFPAQTIRIDSAYARSDARVIVSPMITCEGKPVSYFTPSVLDGKRYHRTQVLRMGNDISHDALAPYIVGTSMEDFTPTTVFTKPMRFKYDPKKRYRGYARISFENYRKVYHEEYVEWWDGSIQDPMRFLSFNSKQTLVPILDERYMRRGVAERMPLKIDGLKVNFLVGKSNMDLRDSVTNASLEKITSTIQSFYDSNDAFIDSMVIKGFASPEGSVGTNSRLSNERAATLRKYVHDRFPNRTKIHDVRSEGHIITWAEVADYLTYTYPNDERVSGIVTELREIISKHNNPDAQFRAARNKDWYEFVNNQVFPELRRVEIEYRAVTNRVRQPEEIFRLYAERGESYIRTARPYEYYQLLKKFNEEDNIRELAKVAQLAYDNTTLHEAVVRDERVIDSVVNNKPYYHTVKSRVYNRPYAFAAYCLVKNKLLNEEVDTVTLKNYIDWSADGRQNQKYWENQNRGWWNDEAFVVLQALMYCQAKDYRKAYETCFYHLPDDQRFEMLRMFIRCMNCEWDNPEVRDYISATSPQNKVAVLIAQDNAQSYREALQILRSDTLKFDNEGIKWYLNALCRFRLTDNNQPDAPLYQGQNCYDPDEELGVAQDFGAPMLKAFQSNPKYVEEIKNDGYFNDSYRLLVWFFWKHIQQGTKMEDIVLKYNAARSQYMNSQKAEQ